MNINWTSTSVKYTEKSWLRKADQERKSLPSRDTNFGALIIKNSDLTCEGMLENVIILDLVA